MSKLERATQVLQSGNTEQRMKAIRYLGGCGEQDALKLLAWSAKNDPEPSIRDYANKGYRHLKGQLGNGQPTAEPTGAVSLLTRAKKRAEQTNKGDEPFDFGYTSDTASDGEVGDSLYADNGGGLYADDDDEGSLYEDGGSLYADDSNDLFGGGTRQDSGPIHHEARRLVDNAMNYHIEGNNQEALGALMKAKAIDPKTVQDAKAKNVGSAITGLDGEVFMRRLDDPAFQEQFITNTRRKSSGKDEDPTWDDVWMEVGLYMLVSVVGLVTIFLVLSGRFSSSLMEIANNPGAYGNIYEGVDMPIADTQMFFELLATSLQWGIVIVVLAGIGFAITAALVNLFNNYLVHLVTVMIFNGKKPSSVTQTIFFRVATVTNGLSYLLFMALLFLVPANLNVLASPYGLQQLDMVSNLTNGLSSLISFGGLVWCTVALGRAHKIGFMNGCFAIIIASILPVALFCGLTFFVFSVGIFGSLT